jgi:tetratricopeptide (TPR) repeat protein
VLAAVDAEQAEAAPGDMFLDVLEANPEELWNDSIASKHLTAGVARRALTRAEAELNRSPSYALRLIDVANGIANQLRDADCRAMLGDVWKQRANAFRHLGRYDEALSAAEIAEAFYGSLSSGDFDVAQAQYTRAATLFKMMRFVEAQQVLEMVTATLRPYGSTLPLAKAVTLDASIRLEQGDVAAAERLWSATLPMLQSLGDEVEQARVRANLAECLLRLGHLTRAMEEARRAVGRYEALGMDAESIRSRWTIGMIHLAGGESDEGVDVLMDVAAAFEACEMLGDAGFAKLDICEEHLRREEWSYAEVAARELAGLFTNLGVTPATAAAIDYLRQAVENKQATETTVRDVRAIIAAADSSRSSSPPPLNR